MITQVAISLEHKVLMKFFVVFFLFQSPSKESIETLSALEIAEQMTYLDHQIFLAIRSE